MIAVFDTNILIDALGGLPQADEEFARYEKVLISRITWIEILVGARGDEAALRAFLETQFEILPLDRDTAETAVELRRKHRIRLPDAIIWATAKVHADVLVTRNTRDFDQDWEGIRVPYHV